MTTTVRFALFIMAIASAVPSMLWAQTTTVSGTVSGTVTDEHTKAPLVGVNVFLSGSTLGAATDATGTFEINNVPPGRHEIVASMIGYAVQTRIVRLSGQQAQTLQFALTPKTVDLEGVEVTADVPRDWRRNERRFRERFFGFTQNASACSLVNPEVLDFTYERRSQKLTAEAGAPLVVENRALGYRIVFHVDHFSGSNEDLDWGGATFFTELEPENEDEQAAWRKRRQRAYEGSLRHFLSALTHQSVRQEGFRLHAVEQPGVPGKGASDDDLMSRLVLPGASPHLREVHYRGTLNVVYMRDNDPGLFGSEKQRHQVSWMELPQGLLTIDDTGRTDGSFSVARYGYWARERVADLLPLDYVYSPD